MVPNEHEQPIPEAEAVNLSDIDVSELVHGIEEYNKQFSVGRVMARAVAGESPSEEDWQHQQQLSLLRSKGKFDPLLQRVGLSLESVKGGATVFSSESKLDAAEIRVNIKDRERFISYLQELDPEKITEGQMRSLKAVFKDLTKQLQNEYEVDNPDDDRMIELLAGLDRILAETDRLDPEGNSGLQESTEGLKRYYEALQGKHLQEYLSVEKAGLLLEIGGNNFGPSKWHTDSSPQFYERKWETALTILQSLKVNKHAADLYARVKDHLEKSAKYAIDDLAQKLEADKKSKYYRPLMDIVNEYYDKIVSA